VFSGYDSKVFGKSKKSSNPASADEETLASHIAKAILLLVLIFMIGIVLFFAILVLGPHPYSS